MGAVRRAVWAGTAALLVTLGLIAGPAAASAATGDVGNLGPSFTGATNAPTADKPQSKMWFTADGQWWANMFDSNSKTWHIFSLDRTAKTWTDTGVQVDTRANTSSDALFDGTTLFIGTQVVRTGTSSSSTSSPMRLYRYTYDAANKKFVSTGSPQTISNFSSESLTIDKDSGGTVWATWTVVSGTTSKVYVNAGTNNGASWGTPFVLPTTGGVNPNVAVDDISTLVAFGTNKVGLLFSNQSDDTVYWSIHSDGAAASTWTGGIAVRGNKLPDDHLNIKSIQADSTGRVFVAVKTSFDHGTNRPTDPQINLLSWKPGSSWSSTTFGTIADCHTRPQVVLDDVHNKVYVFATGKTGTGTCTGNGDGAIYMKTTSLSAPTGAFTPSGSGTIVIRDAASEALNNVTTMKQSASTASGIVILASNNTTKRYWWNDIVAGSGTPTGTAPVSSFTATPTSGPAPLTVNFTNSSTGSPTPTYSWNFGDNTTSTATTPPAHTYSAEGTYTVTLTASNSAGTNSSTKTITVGSTTPPPTGGSITLAGQSTAGNSGAVTAVTIPKPAGVAAGDVLVAQITADAGPNVSAAPAGWTSVASKAASGAKLFVYSHVATASEPTSYTWTLSTGVKWNAGIAAYRGVNTTTPWDTAAVTTSNTATGTTLALPGVTTQTAGALLVGGVAVNSSSAGVTPPSGWSEALEATGIQVTEVAHKVQATAGASGGASWTLSGGSYFAAGWMAALRPAS